MRLKWGKEKIKGLSSPVKKAEVINDWAWWGLFGAVILMAVIFVLKMLGKI